MAVAASPVRELTFAYRTHQIRVPTLLLHGELDARSPLTIAETLRSSIPGAELVVIPGVGHVANLENPQAFNREVRQFVRGVMRMQ